MNEFARTAMLLGDEAMRRLRQAHVAVFGLGGVGSYATEALVRSGIGSLSLFDGDTVDITNSNRQLFAAHSTIGQYKTDVAKRRALDINPDVEVETYPVFYTRENAAEYSLCGYSYVVDAIDMVSSKLELAARAAEAGVPIISAMGAGNKLDPSLFEVADIYKTSVCPLARVMRRELKKRGVEKLKVVYSKEPPVQTEGRVPGSVAFVPSVAGLIMAGEVIKDIAGLGAL